MTTCPRPAARRALDPSPELGEPGEAEPLKASQSGRPGARRAVRPFSRHIPHFMVIPGAAEEGRVTTATGAHRFPTEPTPVLGAAISLLGYDNVESACRPWRRGGRDYRFAHVKAEDPARREVRALSSARLPKV